MEAPLATLPTFTGSVPQRYAIEPLGGPKDTFYYLERFPEEIYTKSPDTHLYKLMRSFLGESGVNWLRKNHLEARIMLEELGIELFDLDRFYGNPFKFGRIVEESFDEDPFGLIPRAQWEIIRAKNARYRNRALDFINGARAGNTPQGMKLVAKSGLGHDVEIIENYKYLYDVHSDDPLGLEYFGKTESTEEMIVLPRREIGQSEQQIVSIQNDPDNAITSGSFSLIYNGKNSADYSYTYDDGSGQMTLNRIPFDGTRDHVRLALESIPEIGPGNVDVAGGPGPYQPWIITFKGLLANRDVQELIVDKYSIAAEFSVSTLVGGKESTDEIVSIPARSQFTLQQAVDRIRPQTTIMTLGESRGLRSRTDWRLSEATSEYSEVVRCVTGNTQVRWPTPTPNSLYWIEPRVENEAPRIKNDLQYHYVGFHSIATINATSSQIDNPAANAIADYTEPLHITSSTELRDGKPASFINGVYPVEYKDLPGAPSLQYTNKTWSSTGRAGAETLTVSFSFVQAVNYISFDVERNPLEIDVEYDAHDGTVQNFNYVTPGRPYNNVIIPLGERNPWASIGLSFTNSLGQMIFTRSLRITFNRIQNYDGPVTVKNLRVARNVS